MMDTLRLRLRIAAGRVYAAGYGLGSGLLRRMIPPDSPLARHKRRLARTLRPQPKRKLGFLLAAFTRAYPQARFVQIGANDGMLEDPLREFIVASRWCGVLVEPVPYLFERLQRTYAGISRVSLENVAIADREGSMPFYYVRESGADPSVPVWHSGLGSFSRDVVLKHSDVIPDLEQRLVSLEVPCLTFTTLCARHGIEQIDLLHMDTEGYDYEILKTIDFARFRPRLLVYEHHHLSAADRAACRQRLAAFGYEATEEGLDVICLNREGLRNSDSLLQAWQLLCRTPGIPA